MRLGRPWQGLAAAMALASVGGGEAAAATPAETVATAAPWQRAGGWSFGVAAGVGSVAGADLDRQVERDNLALASAVGPFVAYTEVCGELRYQAGERLAVEGRFGYLWRDHRSGRMSRQVSALPAVVGLTCYAFGPGRWRAGPVAGAGLLLDVSYTGEDPLGGVDAAGRGMVLEGGFEAEYFLDRSMSLRLRGLGRWAVARGVLPDGGDLDLSGVLGQGAVRLYFQP